MPSVHVTAPDELTIPADCSQKEFVRIVRAIAALGNAHDMLVADAALFAIEHFGKEKGLSLMCSATGYKDFTLVKSARVSREFPPSKRVAGFTFNHYRRLLPFEREWSVGFLKRNAGKNLSSRDLYALAVAEVGEVPYKKKQPKKRAVRIRESLYAKLRPFSGEKVSHFIEGLLEAWLKQQPEATVSKKDEPVVVTPSVEEPRPTYAERRQAQLDAGAPPIPKRKRKPVKLRVAWTECRPDEFVDSENGAVQYKRAHGGPATKFWDEEDAIEAEQKNFEARGYREQVRKCAVCSGGNARKEVFHVFHIYPVFGQRTEQAVSAPPR